MCLKADYYSGLGSNMHAAYSLQIVVSKGLILDYLVSQDRADSKTFIPLLDNYHADYGSFPEKLCADSGHGSLDNYRYMAANYFLFSTEKAKQITGLLLRILNRKFQRRLI